jgi:hypothetical protein
MNTKKINKSILVEKESDASEQNSEIIGRQDVNSNKFEPIDQSKKNKNRKTSVDKE